MAKRKSTGTGWVILLIVVLGLITGIPREAWIALSAAILCLYFVWQNIRKTKTHTGHPVKPNRQETAVIPDLGNYQMAPSQLEPEQTTAPEEVNKNPSAGPKGKQPDISRGSLARASWLRPGELAVVAGINLPDGMVYIGNKYKSNRTGAEPAFINPSMDVAPEEIDISLPLIDNTPDYSTCSPEARKGYLQWLSDGRKSPNADISYVFLFFYGLEHRILIDAAIDPIAKKELPILESEINRLLNVYGKNNAFNHYAQNLLVYITRVNIDEKLYLSSPPATREASTELPLALLVGLGQLALDQKPLPVEWALAWGEADPAINQNISMAHCADVFATLFRQRYQEQYGDGFLLPVNKTKLQIFYRPASAGLMGQEFFQQITDLPNVAVCKTHRDKLRAIFEVCQQELDIYNRFASINPKKKMSLEGQLLMPVALWSVALKTELETIKTRVGYGLLMVTLGELFLQLSTACGTKPLERLSRSHVMALTYALASLQVGIEPDVRADNRTPVLQDTVALFPIESLVAESATFDAYRVTMLTVELACAAVMFDGRIGEPESIILTRHIDAWGFLSPGQRMRLKAYLQPGIRKNNTLLALKNNLEPLSLENRRVIARFLAHLLQVEGTITPQEVKFLERVYKRFALDSKWVYADLDSRATPMTLSLPSATVEVVTDTDRVSLLKKESQELAKLLENLFIAATVATATTPDINPQSLVAITAHLPDSIVTFLKLLISRDSWDREKLVDITADMEVKLDDALIEINRKILAAFDAPLITGDANITINREISAALLI
ncbi:TerB N-terminal domain-containing protein [Yersinia kristensenii]|uniref:tellurite resistance TerB family protein n=1 Tax=Yersinia kristensenii TaxID=28152 RepID=UPI000C1E2E75|nr:TerB N-terminal domain-containing protein [Yersinia kristensenii]MDA5475052.1 TerB N-terminal domain-containing protein [Yersinia kristensenii]MDA5478292.1 TerB N-terminal domain-containing protein [Yersinia kristensenii]MDA5505524.1 TerB N-terminal domain-containing protein [Yersinia kristensenii]MDR4898890.1 TerB N-terminal domain-containing protein [Yersinia kristensenii]MDX6735603.1 TerB N-terminal domain-containing protein [Yersinia kristensenii]